MLAWAKESLAILWGPDDEGVPVLPSSRRLRARQLLMRRVAVVLWFLVAWTLGMAFGMWVWT